MRRILLLLLLSGWPLVGCKKPAQPAGAAQGKGGPPPTQVVVIEARRQPVTESLSLIGTLAPNEMVEIKAEVEGIVEQINFQEGQQVKQGDLLIKLDESKFAASAAEAEAAFKLSKATYERGKQLFKDQLVSQQEFDQFAAQFQANEASLDLKKRQLKDARIYAPFSGVVGARQISPGQVITRNQILTWLVDLDPIKAGFNIPERFLSQIRLGQSIDLLVAAYPGRPFRGEVYFIAPFVEEATRTILVKAQAPNETMELRPGMFANLELTLQIRSNAVVIPEVALNRLLEGDRANVYVVDAAQTAQLRTVKVGVRLKGEAEILEGVQAGEKVVVEGVQKIGPGSKVRLAPAEAAAPYQAAAPAGRPKAGTSSTSGAN